MCLNSSHPTTLFFLFMCIELSESQSVFFFFNHNSSQFVRALVILSDGKTHLAMQAEHKKRTLGLRSNRCQCYVCQSEQEEKYKSNRERQCLWLAFLENVCDRALMMVVETQLRSRCKAQLAHSFHNASVTAWCFQFVGPSVHPILLNGISQEHLVTSTLKIHTLIMTKFHSNVQQDKMMK